MPREFAFCFGHDGDANVALVGKLEFEEDLSTIIEK